jgi:ankyrin repeat protein
MTPTEAKALIEASGLIAAAHDSLPPVQAILEAQPTLIEAMNALTPKDGDETPQRAAAHCRKIDILQYFLSRGVQGDLFTACALGQTELVGAYLEAHPKEIDAKGAHGIALIVHANHPKMVELLITRGIDPSAALVQLAWSGRVELMQVAMDHSAQVNSPKLGRQPLHITAAQGHLEATQLLLKAGAETQIRAKGAEWEFKTPLALAVMNGHTEVAKLLREQTKQFLIRPKNRPTTRIHRPR